MSLFGKKLNDVPLLLKNILLAMHSKVFSNKTIMSPLQKIYSRHKINGQLRSICKLNQRHCWRSIKIKNQWELQMLIAWRYLKLLLCVMLKTCMLWMQNVWISWFTWICTSGKKVQREVWRYQINVGLTKSLY